MAKNIIKARNLEREIKVLKSDPINNKNTLLRASAVLDRLKYGYSYTKLKKKYNVNTTSIRNWVSKYENAKGRGIGVLLDIETQPVNKPIRKTTHDKELLSRIRKEIKKLYAITETDEYENTKTRALAVKEYLKYKLNKDKGLSVKQIADIANSDTTAVNRWVKRYSKKYMSGLMEIDFRPLSRDQINSLRKEKLLVRLNNEIPILEKKPIKYMNTIKRAKAIRDYLMDKGTQEEVGANADVNNSVISKWLNKYNVHKIKGLIEMENHPLKMNKRDASNDETLLVNIKKEIDILKTKDSELSKEILKMAKPIRDYLKNKNTKTQKEIAEKHGVEAQYLSIWLNEYTAEGIKALRVLAKKSINRRKKTSSENINNLHNITIPQIPSKKAAESSSKKRVSNDESEEKVPRKKRRKNYNSL